MPIKVLAGDCRDVLKTMPDESVHCVVTSPPYWGLRDYGTATWEGGEVDCDHVERYPSRGSSTLTSAGIGRTDAGAAYQAQKKQFDKECRKCGARRIDSQIGLEPDFNAYVAAMVEVFSEVRRVLRKDGTLWLNLGDSYTSGGRETRDPGQSKLHPAQQKGMGRAAMPVGLKPKDLCGIPWRVARALQEPYYTGGIKDERDRIWLAAMIDAEGCIFIHKRHAGANHDTFEKRDGTVSQYIRQRDNYGSGLEVANTSERIVQRCLEIAGKGSICSQEGKRRQKLYRWNLRSNECRDLLAEVYPHLVAKQHQARLAIGCPSTGEIAGTAHHALIALHGGSTVNIDFPVPKSLYEPGWYLRQDVIWSKLNPMPESVTDRCTKSHEYLFLLSKSERYYYDADAISENAIYSNITGMDGSGFKAPQSFNGKHRDAKMFGARTEVNGEDNGKRNKRSVWSVATAPFAEAHFATFPPALIEPCILAGCPEGGTVLDPFGGAGTTGLVADRLCRNAILIELNPQYAAMATNRVKDDAGMFAEVL